MNSVFIIKVFFWGKCGAKAQPDRDVLSGE
jgi:hypothetical protein